MKPIVILRNDPDVPPGHLTNALDGRGVPWMVVALDDGARPPVGTGVGAVVVLGGSMGAYDDAEFPYLIAEKDYLRSAVAADVPVLGICLGCQLLADALGGRAYRADRPEARFGRLEVADDPVVGVFGDRPVLSIHRDTWDLPPGGALVAQSSEYPQAFRLGSALGIQPHPEVDHVIVSGWLSTEEGVELARLAGAIPEELTKTMLESHEEVVEAAAAFFGAWIDEVLAVWRAAETTL